MTTIPFKGKGKELKDAAIWIADQTYLITNGPYIIATIPKGSTVKQFETINKGWTMWCDIHHKRWHITGE